MTEVLRLKCETPCHAACSRPRSPLTASLCQEPSLLADLRAPAGAPCRRDRAGHRPQRPAHAGTHSFDGLQGGQPGVMPRCKAPAHRRSARPSPGAPSPRVEGREVGARPGTPLDGGREASRAAGGARGTVPAALLLARRGFRPQLRAQGRNGGRLALREALMHLREFLLVRVSLRCAMCGIERRARARV